MSTHEPDVEQLDNDGTARGGHWPRRWEPVDALTRAEQAQALCAQTDPEAFFPEKGGSTREAKAVCRHCPVRLRCLEVALANGYTDGIWGGLAPRERRDLTLKEAAA